MITKKLYLTIVLLAILTVPFVPLTSVSAVDSPVDTKQELIFLKEVIGIDVDRYEVTLTSSGAEDFSGNDNPIGYIGYVQTHGIYVLVNWDTSTETYSQLKNIFSFANTTLRTCSLEAEAGKPYYSKPLPSSVPEAAKTILDRYKILTGDAELTVMKNMLTNVDVTHSSAKTEGNLRLETTVASERVSFRWIETQNGVDFGCFSLEFKNGAFLTFFDSRSYTLVGSAEVNISSAQAVNIALQAAKNLTYSYNGKLYGNLTIVEHAIRAELKSNVRDSPIVFYPCWIVDLPLDQAYPGYVSFIEVQIWADSGQVISCHTMGYGGPMPDNPHSQTSTTEPTSTPTLSPSVTSNPENQTVTQTENLKQSPIMDAAATIAVAATLISIIIAVVIRTKLKRNNV
jgi:hypothetical protein